jgi:tetratricopeptide (TPR) repeat protein
MRKVGVVLRGMAAALALGAMIVPSLTAGAQSSDEDARKHFEAGESYFKTSDYEGALREFKQAYALSKRPLILLSMAAVYERMGRLQDTIDSLSKYLVEVPDAKDRATVELRIENLKRRLAEQPAAPQDAGLEAAPVTPVPVSTTSAAPLVTTAPPPAAAPNRTPAYVSWGIGGAAAIGAVVTGIVAKGKYDDAKSSSGCGSTPAGCTDDQISPIKSWALVSTVLTGVAVVGAGVGTYFYFAAKPPSAEQATGAMPRLTAGASAGGGGVSASWVF